jgi:hypothetical protein
MRRFQPEHHGANPSTLHANANGLFGGEFRRRCSFQLHANTDAN